MHSEKEKNIKVFLFDLEGVLIPKNISDDSAPAVKSIEAAGRFFNLLNSLGYHFGIVTMRSEGYLIEQLKKIPGCIVITSTIDKVTPVEAMLKNIDAGFDNLFYMGDDMFDIPLLNKASLSAAPSNAHKEVKRIAGAVITYAIVEDLFDYILKEIIGKK